MDIPFAIQSYKDDSLPVSAQSCVNAYAELEPPDAKTPVKVQGVPGVDLFATCGVGPVRGMCDLAGLAYVVSGNALYTVDNLANVSLIGAGISGTAPVSMAPNGIQIAITNGVSGYIYDTSTVTFQQILDPSFVPASTVTCLDDYFIFDHVGTNQFILSDLLDGTTYDPTMFASAESDPDRVIGVHGVNGTLAIAGERTIEFWQDTGAVDFPWQVMKGATVERGVASPLAWAEEDDGHFFLGNDLVFYRLVGTQPQRASTHALEKEWATYSTTADAFCHSVTFGGHKFIYLTFPTANVTYGFDVATNLWHQRASTGAGGALNRWRANCSLLAFSSTKMLIGDSLSGAIGAISPTNYGTEFGTPILLDMISPHIDGHGVEVFMPEFQLDMEGGTGIATGQGSDPQVMMSYSDDGGRTWSNEAWMPLGQVGQYLLRLRWTRLGSFYQRALRIKISDPVKRTIIRARAPGLYYGMSGG